MSVSDSGGITLTDSSSTTFFYKSEQVESGIQILWDLDGDGDFDEPEEDITKFVTDAEIIYGRNQSSQLLGQVSPGRFRATLNNTDDRFGYFNENSPLVAPPFNMRSSAKLRIQTVGTPLTGVDPVDLAYDFFENDGSLIKDSIGSDWLAADDCYIENGLLKSSSQLSRPWVDIDTPDFYAQIQIERQHQSSLIGIMYRHQTNGDSGVVYIEPQSHYMDIKHAAINAAGDIVTDYGVIGQQELIDGRFLGVNVQNDLLTVYVDGEIVTTATPVAAGASSGVGVYMRYGRGIDQDRSINQFQVWDAPPQKIPGVLYTCRMSNALPTVSGTGFKTVNLEGEGILSGPATADIETLDTLGKSAPFLFGITTGQYAGNCLLKAGVGPLASIRSTITLGSTTNESTKCLQEVRAAENIEFGRLIETPEGYIEFADRGQVLTGGQIRGEWSDSDTGGLAPEYLAIKNWRSEKRNRVTSFVGPSLATIDLIQVIGNQSNPGVTMAVSMPSSFWAATSVGQLVLCVITHSIATAGESWLVPSGWRDVRQDSGSGKDGVGKFRVYGHIVTEEDLEFTPEVTFYEDTEASGGNYYIETYNINNFHGSLAEGLHVSSTGFMDGYMTDAARRGVITHPGVGPPWGGEPTLHIYGQLGVNTGISQGGYLETPTKDLIPYQSHDQSHHQDNNATSFVKDISSVYSVRNSTKNPSEPFRFFHQHVHYQNLELVDIMVRGFKGEGNTESRVRVVSDDYQSQKESGAVLSYELSGINFKDIEDAELFNQLVLQKYSKDSPTLTMNFTANKSSTHRQKAADTRIGDKIYIDSTGKSGLGVKGLYTIESISHRFSQGSTLWSVEWGLAEA